MKLGVVGLPNVGKSTLFNAITNAGAQAENYPFCTIEPNTGIVPVPDHRLDVLAEMYHPKKVTPAIIEFVDIAGLVRGASRGEGLGNKFLSHIREVDAIVHVVRCFEDDNIIHVDGSVDPMRDIETINLELIFADMETVQKRREKAEKSFRGGDKKAADEAGLAERLYAHLESGKPARTLECTDDEKQIMYSWFLLTTKPVIYAANISEDDLGKDEKEIPFVVRVKEAASWAIGKAYDGTWASLNGFVSLGAADGATGLPEATWSLKNYSVDEYKAQLADIVSGKLQISSDVLENDAILSVNFSNTTVNYVA